jgi:ABC-2 type transport system permease protein
MLVLIKKEILEGIRTYRFLSILVVLTFFSILNPVMNKMILPEILKSQFEGIEEEMLSQMIISNQTDCLRAFMGDIFEIGTLVIVLVTAALIAGERKEKTLILPVCSNKKMEDIVLAKNLVYGVFTIICIVLAILIDYLYAGVLFGYDGLEIGAVIAGGIYIGIYYYMVISIVMFIGTLLKNTITTALISMLLVYGSNIIAGFFENGSKSPKGLFDEAMLLSYNMREEIIVPIIVTLSISFLLTVITIIRMKKLDLVTR